MKNTSKLGAILFSILAAAPAIAANPGVRSFHIKGIAVTGPNDVCGEPQWRIPDPLPPDLHGIAVGEYDPTPGANQALPLSPTNCRDGIVLATTTDTAFLSEIGFPDADPRLKNVPLRDVPVIATPDGIRMVIPPLGALPPNPFPPTRNNHDAPITLGKWLSARGDMAVKCKDRGSAYVKIRFKNLIPEGLYTLWALWKTTPPGAPGPAFVPLPFGGVPNAFVSDKNGNGSFERNLDLCPTDPAPDGSQLLIVDLAYHSDASLTGATPELPAGSAIFSLPDGTTFSSPLPPGTVAHDHVNFPITVPDLSQ